MNVTSSSPLDAGSLNIGDWPAWLALAVAGVSLFLQFRDYFFRVRMSVLEYLVPYVEGRLSLAMVHLAFVNPSSRGVTVCDLDIKSSLKDVPVRPVNFEYDKDFRNLIYRLANDDSGRIFPMPISESLRIPLDILPHQSVSKWIVFSLGLPDYAKNPMPTVLEIRAYDHRKKFDNHKGQLAYCWKQAVAGEIIAGSWPF